MWSNTGSIMWFGNIVALALFRCVSVFVQAKVAAEEVGGGRGENVSVRDFVWPQNISNIYGAWTIVFPIATNQITDLSVQTARKFNFLNYFNC